MKKGELIKDHIHKVQSHVEPCSEVITIVLETIGGTTGGVIGEVIGEVIGIIDTVIEAIGDAVVHLDHEEIETDMGQETEIGLQDTDLLTEVEGPLGIRD